MVVGLLKEIAAGEQRVALTPASIRRLVEHEHHVVVEHSAGGRSHFSDDAYSLAGAQIAFSAAEVIDRSELIVKVERPTNGEIEQLHPGHTVMGFFHMVTADQRQVRRLLSAGINTIGYEIIETVDGRLPVLEPVSEIAGQFSITVAAQLLRSTSGGRGILLGGAPGIPPARVVILGAGVVGTWAAKTALSAGATTLVLDNDVAKLRRLMAAVTGVVTGLADVDAVSGAVRTADVLIGAVLLHGERTPHIVTRQMVETMRPGAVVVDISVDQGGCVETSRPTTLADPVFVHKGVVHYCVPNMTADIAHTASAALSHACLPYVLEIALHGIDHALERRFDLERAVYTFRGRCTHAPLAARWSLRFQEVRSLIRETTGVES